MTPISTGLAVQNSTASAAMRSAFSTISDASATSQPPVIGTPVNTRVRVSPSFRAVTVNCGVVVQVSCSMYEPSLLAKYFHSCSSCTEALTLVTSVVLTTRSTTFWTSACFSSCGTVAGSFLIGVAQYSW